MRGGFIDTRSVVDARNDTAEVSGRGVVMHTADFVALIANINLQTRVHPQLSISTITITSVSITAKLCILN